MLFSRPEHYSTRHPVLAFLHVFGAFAFCSLVFNLFVEIAIAEGVASFFLSLTLIVGGLALFTVPIARAARSSRRFHKLVLLAAAIAAFLIYVAALRYDVDSVTDWLFPHWPGAAVHYSIDQLQLAAICGAFLYGVTCLVMWGGESDSPRPNEEAAALALAQEGMGSVSRLVQTQDPAVEIEVDLD